MAEMGYLFKTSYQKINVVLFCYVEPALFFVSVLSFLYVLFRLPAHVFVGKSSLWLMGIVIAIVIILLVVSAIAVLVHIGDSSRYLKSINGVSLSNKIAGIFDGTVLWLEKLAAFFHATYETANVWVYILIMPIGIAASFVSIMMIV